MPKRKPPEPPDYGLELLLGYHGRIEYLPGDHYLRFEIYRVEASEARPHGLRYSFTLHDSHNRRILGFDNAHSVKPPGRSARRSPEHDHWHRTSSDKGIPYRFVDAPRLLDDFYREARRTLADRGIALDIIDEQNAPEDE